MRPFAILLTILALFCPGRAAAQEESPIATDRPGFLFSSLSVGRGIFQIELGLPTVALIESGDADVRTTSFSALLRHGITDDLELRLGAPVYADNETGSGYGDLELGARWHILDNEGSRPSFALIPSVILPTGEDGFTADDPVYQLNAALEWALADGWGLAGLAGILNGPSGGDRYMQETFALSLGRSLSSPAWSAYGEAAHIVTDLDGAGDASFLGGGVKYLISSDTQLDLSFDRGLTDESPDWLLGLGLSARF